MNHKKSDLAEKKARGLRIKEIRENELHMTKTELARELDISSQFLGLVEEGRGNLVYRSIKKLREISGHSSDYILFGIDDEVIEKTKRILKEYGEIEIINAIDMIKRISFFIRNR